MCLECGSARCQNKQGSHVKGGERAWRACVSEKFCLGKYFVPLRCRPEEQKESTDKIGFALINGRLCNGIDAVVAV